MIEWYVSAFDAMPLALRIFFVGLFGSLVGSFMNVCIWRIPRGRSIVTPRSCCCSCGHPLGVADLVPVLSYLWLGGRCRYCGAPFSARYPLVEAWSAMVWIVSYLVFDDALGFLIAAVSADALTVLVMIFLSSAGGENKARDGDECSSSAACSCASRDGLTFLEILFTSVVLAVVVGPFLNLNWQSRAVAWRNRERIMALNLARERMEELTCLPVRSLKSDWDIYRGESSGSSTNIFRDESFGTRWDRMDEDPAFFYANFSDVQVRGVKPSKENFIFHSLLQRKFVDAFKRYYGFDYEFYPSGYEKFRRYTLVKDLTDPRHPGDVLKRVTVVVEINSAVHSRYKVQLVTYFAQ